MYWVALYYESDENVKEKFPNIKNSQSTFKISNLFGKNLRKETLKE